MNKSFIAKLLLIGLSVVGLIIPSLSTTAFATTSSGFDASIDGLVTNFENYQSFGGKNGVAAQSVTYNVFLPSGMGFNPSNHVLEMLYSGGSQGSSQSIAYESNSPNEAGTCKATSSGGYNCSVKWVFGNADPALIQGAYTISFVVLNSNTMPVNGIYMNLLGSGSSNPIYAEAGQVFINEPLTAPYASFDSGVQSLYTLVNRSSLSSIPFTVDINAGNPPTKVVFYFDGQLAQSVTNYNKVANYSYSGGEVDQFHYTLSGLNSLSNGDHILTATAIGNGYSVPVVTQDGQSTINIEAAYGSDQSCATQVSSINLITKNVTTQETTELNQIESIDNQAIAYFAKNPPSISSYSQLVNTINNDNKNVYAELATLAKDNSFQCSDISNQITTFITDLNKVYADLGTYQTDSVNLLNKAGGLSG